MIKLKFKNEKTLTNLYSIGSDTDILNSIFHYYDETDSYAPHITKIAKDAAKEYIMSIDNSDSSLREMKRLANMFIDFKYNISITNVIEKYICLEYSQVKNLLILRLSTIDKQAELDDMTLSKIDRILNIILKSKNVDYTILEFSNLEGYQYQIVKKIFSILYQLNKPCILYNDSIKINDEYINIISQYHSLYTMAIYGNCWYQQEGKELNDIYLSNSHFKDIWPLIRHKTIL